MWWALSHAASKARSSRSVFLTIELSWFLRVNPSWITSSTPAVADTPACLWFARSLIACSPSSMRVRSSTRKSGLMPYLMNSSLSARRPRGTHAQPSVWLDRSCGAVAGICLQARACLSPSRSHPDSSHQHRRCLASVLILCWYSQTQRRRPRVE